MNDKSRTQESRFASYLINF